MAESKLSKAVGYTLLGVVGLLGGLLLLGALLPESEPEDAVERIEHSCQAEFAPDDEAVMRCQTALMVQLLRDAEREKFERAYRNSQ